MGLEQGIRVGTKGRAEIANNYMLDSSTNKNVKCNCTFLIYGNTVTVKKSNINATI